MYSRNCGKSRTGTNHANVIRHAGEQEGWEFRSYVTSRFNIGCKTVLLEVHENIAATLCIWIVSDSKTILQSTVFLVAVPRRAIQDSFRVTACVKIRLPRIFLARTNMRAKNPTKERSLLSSSFPPYSQQSPLQATLKTAESVLNSFTTFVELSQTSFTKQTLL